VAESSSDFRGTLLELIEASPEPMDHPSPDQWLAYQRGELSADEEARFQEHLVRCRDCFDLAAAAASFAQPDETPDATQEMETAALWRLLRPQLDPPAQNVRKITEGPRRPSRRFRLPMKLAATFFVALVGMTVWNLQQRSDLKAAQAAQANAPIFDFIASQRGPAGQERTLPAGPQMLVLHPDPSEQLPVYRLAIRDAVTGRELPSYELRLNGDLALTLYFPKGLLPGHYRMELADGGGKVLETYLLRVTAPE